MSKHDPAILEQFKTSTAGYETFTDRQLLDALNPIVAILEKDDTYSTSAKLKIYLWISQLSNCAPKDRKKYIRRIGNKLK
jgi:hypothetical protein